MAACDVKFKREVIRPLNVAYLLHLTYHYLSHNCRIHLMHLFHPVTSSKSLSRYTSGCCIRRRSRIVISTSSLLWSMPRWDICVGVIGSCVEGNETAAARYLSWTGSWNCFWFSSVPWGAELAGGASHVSYQYKNRDLCHVTPYSLNFVR